MGLCESILQFFQLKFQIKQGNDLLIRCFFMKCLVGDNKPTNLMVEYQLCIPLIVIIL